MAEAEDRGFPLSPSVLAALLKTTNVKPKVVAIRLGVEMKTLQRWLNGKSRPYLSNAKQIADFFHVSLDVLEGKAPIPERDTTVRDQALLKALGPFVPDGNTGMASVFRLVMEAFKASPIVLAILAFIWPNEAKALAIASGACAALAFAVPFVLRRGYRGPVIAAAVTAACWLVFLAFPSLHRRLTPRESHVVPAASPVVRGRWAQVKAPGPLTAVVRWDVGAYMQDGEKFLVEIDPINEEAGEIRDSSGWYFFGVDPGKTRVTVWAQRNGEYRVVFDKEFDVVKVPPGEPSIAILKTGTPRPLDGTEPEWGADKPR